MFTSVYTHTLQTSAGCWSGIGQWSAGSSCEVECNATVDRAPRAWAQLWLWAIEGLRAQRRAADIPSCSSRKARGAWQGRRRRRLPAHCLPRHAGRPWASHARAKRVGGGSWPLPPVAGSWQLPTCHVKRQGLAAAPAAHLDPAAPLTNANSSSAMQARCLWATVAAMGPRCGALQHLALCRHNSRPPCVSRGSPAGRCTTADRPHASGARGRRNVRGMEVLVVVRALGRCRENLQAPGRHGSKGTWSAGARPMQRAGRAAYPLPTATRLCAAAARLVSSRCCRCWHAHAMVCLSLAVIGLSLSAGAPSPPVARPAPPSWAVTSAHAAPLPAPVRTRPVAQQAAMACGSAPARNAAASACTRAWNSALTRRTNALKLPPPLSTASICGRLGSSGSHDCTA